MKKSILRSALPLFIGITALFFSCSKSTDNGPGGGGSGGSSASTIYMKNSVFSSPDISLVAGSKVTWVNDDDMAHTVTANNGSFNSGTLSPGTSFSYTFTTVGVFSYHCMFHGGMTGVVRIIVR